MDAARPNNQLLLRLISATSLRHRVIANNIANSNTPGFERQTVSFEDRLYQEMHKKSAKLGGVMPRIEVDNVTPASFDGNNVSMEVEMNSLNENRLMYELYSSILHTKTEMLRASIQER